MLLCTILTEFKPIFIYYYIIYGDVAFKNEWNRLFTIEKQES